MPPISFTANGRSYAPPAAPIVVLCLDGCGDEYLSTALAHDRMPRLRAMCRDGYRGLVRGALPSFTNVNNAAMVTGMPPQATGISGNYFLNPETGEEVMMNAASFLRCETIFARAAEAGRTVACLTAKDKLRSILSAGLPPQAISLSAEKSPQQADQSLDLAALSGMSPPQIYSAEASLWVLRVGASLVEQQLADFVYLSLTDYMQHRYAPDEPPVLDFYQAWDVEFGRLLDAGAIIGATADHGMNAKTTPTGEPQVLFVESLLRDAGLAARVICPITDPYVAHHGALGSLVMVHLNDAADAARATQLLWQQAAVTEVWQRELAAQKLELPSDRIGDLVVLSARDWVLGRTPADHDLSQLAGALRSHGGRYEEMVPLLLSRPLNDAYRRRAAADPRNFDVFDFVCNGAAS